jgi:hypothetical protein
LISTKVARIGGIECRATPQREEFLAWVSVNMRSYKLELNLQLKAKRVVGKEITLPGPSVASVTSHTTNSSLQANEDITRQLNEIQELLRNIQSHSSSTPFTTPDTSAHDSALLNHATTVEPLRKTQEVLPLAKKNLIFSKEDIPDPPNKSFSQNIAELDEMWDDVSPQWNNKSPLIICGTPIALKYWPDVYKYRLPMQWTGIKQRWHQYKVRTAVVRFQELIPEPRILSLFIAQHPNVSSGKNTPYLVDP